MGGGPAMVGSRSKAPDARSYLMAGLRAPGLHRRQPVVVARNGVVVLNALLGTALLVDLHQRQRGGVVLHQTHLRGNRHNAGDWGRERGAGCRQSRTKDTVKPSPKYQQRTSMQVSALEIRL